MTNIVDEPLPEPSDFRATFWRRWGVWTGYLERCGTDNRWEIVKPCDEYASPIRALSLESQP